MNRFYSWTGFLAIGATLILAPAYSMANEINQNTIVADNTMTTGTRPLTPPVPTNENVPVETPVHRPNAAETAAQAREKAAKQRTRARRTPKAQTKPREARGQEPQLVDIPDPVDINSD